MVWRGPLPTRTLMLALGQGLVGGAVTAMILGAMHALQGLVWDLTSARWHIPVVIMIGAGLLVLLHRWAEDTGVSEQVADAAEPLRLHRRRTAFVGLSAIVAVAFGGAIGPEAGLVAVMSEISAIVSIRLARSHAEEQVIGEAGTAGSLGALYAAPIGSAMFTRTEDTLRLANVVAGTFGLLSFLCVHKLFHAPGAGLELRPVDLAARDVLASLVAGLFGAVLSLGYLLCRRVVGGLAARVPSSTVRILLGSALFAGLATAFPAVRFSGHEDVGSVIALAGENAWWMLAGIAVLKLVATSINLSSGWLGGDFFPLVLTGSAAGLLSCGFLGLPPEAAAVAGMTAAAMTGIRKPAAVFVIVLLLCGGVGIGAAVAGAAVGLLACQLPLGADESESASSH